MKMTSQDIGAYELWKKQALTTTESSISTNARSSRLSSKPVGRVNPLNEASYRTPRSFSTIRLRCCSVCARLEFYKSNIYSAMLNYDDQICNSVGGYTDPLSDNISTRMSQQNVKYKVNKDVARLTADAAEAQARVLRREMLHRGLLQNIKQNFAGESNCARIVAPFHLDELKLGQLLGVGGFSAVLEVVSFQLDSAKAATVTPEEDMSRQYLSNHAVRLDSLVQEKQSKFGCRWRNFWRRKRTEVETLKPIPRYALKHIRFNVADSPDKLRRSCIDLVLEGQLLLAMDHPNIMGIRGWPLYGTDAIRSGYIMNYFLILDKLNELLEERLWKWRITYLKYKARCSFPLFQTQKYGPKLDKLFLDRLQTVRDVASAIQYMHSKGIIHRDIKSSNIGFDVRGDVKLFDFGLSRLLPVTSSSYDGNFDGESDGVYCMSRVGTKIYTAPEVRKRMPYGLPADVYSFGVLLWEILALSSPRDYYHKIRKSGAELTSCQADATNDNFHRSYTIDNPMSRRNNITSDEFFDNGKVRTFKAAGWLPVCFCWPRSIQHLVISCLSIEPSYRPSMDEVLDHITHIGSSSFLNEISSSLDDNDQRRRSTLRIDLTALRSTTMGCNDLLMFQSATIAEASCDSKTSGLSSEHMTSSHYRESLP